MKKTITSVFLGTAILTSCSSADAPKASLSYKCDKNYSCDFDASSTQDGFENPVVKYTYEFDGDTKNIVIVNATKHENSKDLLDASEEYLQDNNTVEDTHFNFPALLGDTVDSNKVQHTVKMTAIAKNGLKSRISENVNSTVEELNGTPFEVYDAHVLQYTYHLNKNDAKGYVDAEIEFSIDPKVSHIEVATDTQLWNVQPSGVNESDRNIYNVKIKIEQQSLWLGRYESVDSPQILITGRSDIGSNQTVVDLEPMSPIPFAPSTLEQEQQIYTNVTYNSKYRNVVSVRADGSSFPNTQKYLNSFTWLSSTASKIPLDKLSWANEFTNGGVAGYITNISDTKNDKSHDDDGTYTFEAMYENHYGVVEKAKTTFKVGTNYNGFDKNNFHFESLIFDPTTIRLA